MSDSICLLTKNIFVLQSYYNKARSRAMERDFNNSRIEQVYDDFNYRKTDFDVALEDAVKDLEPVVEQAQKIKNKRETSDEITALLEDFGDRIAEGFASSSFAKRREVAPKLAQIYSSTIYFNPQNTEKVLSATDKLLNGYERMLTEHPSHSDAEVYNALKKIYTTAIRNVRNQSIFKAATQKIGSIVNKVEIIKGNATPDKFLARLATDNPKTEDIQLFKESFKYELESNHERAFENVFAYVKATEQIKDEKIKSLAQAIVVVGYKSKLEKMAKQNSDSPENMKEIEKNMMSVLDMEEIIGLSALADKNRTHFEEKMLGKRRKRDNKLRLDKQIYTFLNIPSKKLGVVRNPDKPFYPNKKDMTMVTNLLSQYSKIEYDLILAVMGRLDTEKFTNVDDKILDKINSVTPRMEYGEEIAEKLTGIRTQLHSKGLQAKKESAKVTVMNKEQKSLKVPPTRAVIDVKKLPDGSLGSK